MTEWCVNSLGTQLVHSFSSNGLNALRGTLSCLLQSEAMMARAVCVACAVPRCLQEPSPFLPLSCWARPLCQDTESQSFCLSVTRFWRPFQPQALLHLSPSPPKSSDLNLPQATPSQSHFPGNWAFLLFCCKNKSGKMLYKAVCGQKLKTPPKYTSIISSWFSLKAGTRAHASNRNMQAGEVKARGTQVQGKSSKSSSPLCHLSPCLLSYTQFL